MTVLRIKRTLGICVLLLTQTFLYTVPLKNVRLSAVQSCAGKCGEVRQLPCSCDLKCPVYKNCCEDFNHDCPHVLKSSKELYRKQWQANVACINSAFTITNCVDESPETYTSHVTSEHNATTESSTMSFHYDHPTRLKIGWSYTESQLMDVIRGAPVTDTDTGFLYLNMDVFRCFSSNTSNPATWDTMFELRKFETPTSIQEFAQYVSIRAQPHYVPRANSKGESNCISPNDPIVFIDSCIDGNVSTTINPEWSQKCNEFFSYEQYDNGTGFSYFKNRYCALCHESHHVTTEPVRTLEYSIYNHLFPVVASLGNDKLQLSRVSMERNAIGWEEVVCNVTSSLLQITSGECDVISCVSGFVQSITRYCGKIFKAHVAFPGDEFPFDRAQIQHLPSFFLCHLKNMYDIHKNGEPESFQLHDESKNRKLYGLTFQYISRNSEGQVDRWYTRYLPTLLSAAKAFKYYRQLGFTQHQTNTMKENSESMLKQEEHVRSYNRRYEFSYAKQSDKRSSSGLNVSVCMCASQGPPRGCVFGCYYDYMYDYDRQLTSDPCFQEFKSLLTSTNSSTDDSHNSQAEQLQLSGPLVSLASVLLAVYIFVHSHITM